MGILIAFLGGVFLALGAQFQHRGVSKVEISHGNGAKQGLSVRQLQALLARPSWVIGTVMLGLAIVMQLIALAFAPLIVVQPIGVVALVITSILNARVTAVRLDGRSIGAIVMCVGGVAVFVSIAAVTATEHRIGTQQLTIILIILGAVVVAYAIAFAFLRQHMRAIFYIIGAGVLYGFVATLAKSVLTRIITGDFDWLTFFAVVVLLGATALGGYFVQTAYSVGAPELVIAGLTVVDPMVAVVIAVVVLGEASQAPLWAVIGFVLAGAVAIAGVFTLAKHHPQTHR
ncbi:DMT family transporter [Salinibacterium sp. ZJ450]|uniref:DMT family transporter n=1 Tax=Salinibacterium sp. ZJ450 TaxID=2708338 RepID=UPI001CD64514|nr:DMT family transporter [Salinibacterium sp. ZJ450]